MRTPPEHIPPVPEGFEYYGEGPLKRPSEIPSKDVAIYCRICGKWETGFKGEEPSFHYALRIGSEIHRKNMPLKIEAGKYYRTRDGMVVGPMEDASGFFSAAHKGVTRRWKGAGQWGLSLEGEHNDRDLVEEVPAPSHRAMEDENRELRRLNIESSRLISVKSVEIYKLESTIADLRVVIDVGRIALDAIRRERDEAREKLAELLNSPIDTPTPKH